MILTTYGYSKGPVNDDGLLELSEVTVCGTPHELRVIAQFFTRAATLAEENPALGHLHLCDEIEETLGSCSSDLIIVPRHQNQEA